MDNTHAPKKPGWNNWPELGAYIAAVQQKASALMPDTRPKFYLCGGCEHWHPFGWTGDCRDNGQRFTTDKLDTLYPDKNGDGWPDWVEVDEATGEEN